MNETEKLLKRFNYRPRRALRTFVASYEEEDGAGKCAVTVQMIEPSTEDEPDWFIAIIVQLFNPHCSEGSEPDCWDAQWVHYVSMLKGNFWPYIDEHCPAPELVHKAVANLNLPSELAGLFEEEEVTA
jgi:hypothetical protein